MGTHLDGEIHFFTPGKDIASLPLNDFLVGPGVVVDLSDATGDYQIYIPQMIEERVEVREGDILIIHTDYHYFGWDQCPGQIFSSTGVFASQDAEWLRMGQTRGRESPRVPSRANHQ